MCIVYYQFISFLFSFLLLPNIQMKTNNYSHNNFKKKLFLYNCGKKKKPKQKNLKALILKIN